MSRSFVFFLICFGMCVAADKANFSFTYEMASRCKEHICQRGYSYDVYYNAYADLKHSPQVVGSEKTFEMHIAIQASSNGHILLSPIAFPEPNDPVYEIVVGGGGNKFTELRRNLKRNAKASLRTDKILSSVELRGFYIRMSSGGLIEFGQEGSSLPLLSFLDMYPLDINFFSFAAWNGVEAKFLYDCPPPGEDGQDNTGNRTVIENSRRIERNLSFSEQLKREKLQDRPPHMPPLPTVPVSIVAKLSTVSMNAFEAKLTTRMTLLTTWNDEGLAWNPEKFNGLTNITYRQGQIWKPTFHVYNSDNLNALKTTGYELISMDSNGAATFHFKASFQTWCYTETEDYNRWPRDVYKCSIVIQPWEAHEIIELATIKDKTFIFDTIVDKEDMIQNGWELTELRQFVVPALSWNKMYPLQSNITHQSDRFVISLTLQREPTNYNIAIYTPLVVLMTFVLMSFLSEPVKMSRVWFYAGATVFICAGLSFIDYLIPCHTIPTILILYLTVLGSILLALILQVMMMTSVAEKLCKTTPMQSVLSSHWFRTVFGLPVEKICRNYNSVNDGYSQQEDEDMASAVFAPNGNVEAMHAEVSTYCEKEELGEALDKIMFVVYSILFAAMLAAHY